MDEYTRKIIAENVQLLRGRQGIGETVVGVPPRPAVTKPAAKPSREADEAGKLSQVEPTNADILDVLRIEQEVGIGRPLTDHEMRQFAQSF